MKNKIILPSQVFFNPTDNFLKWMEKNFRKHSLIDCGAGVGRLSRLLKNAGLNVLSIDLHEREESESIVLCKDSTSFDFPEKSVAIIARPNRGNWIHDTIDNALKTCSSVLYIGIKEHIAEDIETLNNLNVEKVFENAGEDNEIAYRINKKDTKEVKDTKEIKTKYFLVKTHPCADPNVAQIGWYEEGNNKWINFHGGWQPKNKKDEILETKEADDIHDLDWRKTSLVNDREISGWLDRSGSFTGCNSQAHDLIADLVFNKTVEEMENQGYVRIYNSEEYACRKNMSVEQRNYMLYKGFKISDLD